MDVHGEVLHDQFRVLTIEASSVPNAIAAVLLDIGHRTRQRPHIYFERSEGNPLGSLVEVPVLRSRRGRTAHPRGAASR